MIEASKVMNSLGDGLDGLDKWVKRFAAVAAVVLALSVIVPPFGKFLNLVSASRFGANGIIKYELGTDDKNNRVPTSQGQLRLLRNGPREFANIRRGDIVQAMSEIRFHESNDCVRTQKCAAAPIVFDLQKGDCAIVLGKAYVDDGKDTESAKGRKGGWLHVATTACGLFK